MKAEIVNVTPQLAAEFLEKNANNRSLSNAVVEHYAMQMRSGKWIANGETIKFGSNGELVDGQHRLQAIIQSGVTVTMVVVTGVPEGSKETIDVGKVRFHAYGF